VRMVSVNGGLLVTTHNGSGMNSTKPHSPWCMIEHSDSFRGDIDK
jgi:hypothetical protein